MSLKIILAASALALALQAPAFAQEADSMDHSKMDHGTMDATEMTEPKGDKGPSSTAFAEANAKMHAAMAITFTGDTDKDFVRGMIAHHQGAIDMAKIELEYGKDATLRKLAEEIIAAQEGEIRLMTDWLAKNGG